MNPDGPNALDAAVRANTIVITLGEWREYQALKAASLRVVEADRAKDTAVGAGDRSRAEDALWDALTGLGRVLDGDQSE